MIVTNRTDNFGVYP